MPDLKHLFTSILFLALSFTILGQPERELAQQYVEDGEYSKATPLLEGLYQKNPSGPIFNDLLTCYIQLKEYKEAKKLIENHRKRVPGQQAGMAIHLLYIHSLSGDEKGYRETEDELLQMVRQRPGVAGSLSQECSRYGLYKTALDVLNSAESQLPNMNLGYQKALVYADMGDLENMFREYLDLLGTNPGYTNMVKNTLNQSLQDDPNDPVNLMFKKQLIRRVQTSDNVIYNSLLIWMLIREKDYRAAMVQLRALERRGLNQSSSIMSLAESARQEEEWAVAIEAYDHIINKGVSDGLYEDALVQRLMTRKQMMNLDPNVSAEDWRAWIIDLEEVQKEIQYPENEDQLILLKGIVLQGELNETEQARKIFQDLIDRSGISTSTRLNAKMELAGLTLQEGEYIDALLLYAQVEKEVPETPIGQQAKYMKAKVAYYRGDFEYAQGQFDALKASTSKLIANDAMYMWLLIKSNSGLDTSTAAMETFAAADLAFFRNRFDQALDILDQLRVQFPNHELEDDALFMEARIYEEQSKPDTALVIYQKLVDQHKKSLLVDDALYRSGLLEERLGNLQKAMEYYQQLLQQHPDSFFAPDSRKRFRRLRGDDLVN